MYVCYVLLSFVEVCVVVQIVSELSFTRWNMQYWLSANFMFSVPVLKNAEYENSKNQICC